MDDLSTGRAENLESFQDATQSEATESEAAEADVSPFGASETPAANESTAPKDAESLAANSTESSHSCICYIQGRH